jgi:hypothetical protein
VVAGPLPLVHTADVAMWGGKIVGGREKLKKIVTPDLGSSISAFTCVHVVNLSHVDIH